MAGDWIKMRCDLSDDPAVVQIASQVGVTEDEVVGKLHRLWSWADRHTKDGKALGITAKWVNKFLNKDGFAEAMCAAGWLAFDDNSLQFPNFCKHNGSSAKRRADATERKKRSRKCHNNVTKTSRATCDKSVTREEKRREEKREGEESPSTPLATEKPSQSGEAKDFADEEFREDDDPAEPEGFGCEPEWVNGSAQAEEPSIWLAVSSRDSPNGCATSTLFGDGAGSEGRQHETNSCGRKRARTPRDDLFDAVCKITGANPKTAAANVSKVCNKLLESDPPFTPEEVLRLPETLLSTKPGFRGTLSVFSIPSLIGDVRGGGVRLEDIRSRKTALEIAEAAASKVVRQ